MNILLLTKLTDDLLHKTSEFEMSEELRKRGHVITIIMAKKIGEKKIKNDEFLYLPTINYPMFSGLLFGLIILLYLPIVARKKKIDAIIIDEATVWLPFTSTLKLFGFPLFLDVRTLPIDREKSIFFEITLDFCKYIVDGITTITPELEKILVDKYHLQNKKIGIWSSGVSQRFINAGLINEKIKFSKESKLFILMYHGTYSITRGIENLIKSLGEIDADLRKKINLIIIGFSQDEIRFLMPLCGKLGVQELVKFLPKVRYEDIPSYIAESDVGVYPLPPEDIWWQVSAPLKTLEYLAMGKPVIVTNIPFHQRIFEKGECGVLLDSNSPKELANAIIYLYKNKDKLDSMGRKGMEIVEKYHSWKNEAINLEKFLETIIKSN